MINSNQNRYKIGSPCNRKRKPTTESQLSSSVTFPFFQILHPLSFSFFLSLPLSHPRKKNESKGNPQLRSRVSLHRRWIEFVSTATMQPENFPESSQLYRFLVENGLIDVGPYGSMTTTSSLAIQNMCSSSNSSYQDHNFYPFEGSFITDMTPQDKALAALRNHKEAEKRRRERINSHLEKLRSLLPCNSKTDKASLLAKVVQRVRELKQETSHIPGLETFPSEADEITVLSGEYSDDGQLIFKASLCCEDRTDLLPELIEILKSLKLKTLRAEMATLGGRVRNILIVEADKEHSVESIRFLQSELKSLLERSGGGGGGSGDRSKRRRVLDRKMEMLQ